MSDAFDDRRRELEETFFKKQNEASLLKLKREQQLALDRAALTQLTGITHGPLLDRLLALNLTVETVTALSLYPLVEVAWADGAVDEKETRAVLEAAQQVGLKAGSAAHGLISEWLVLKPPAALQVAWYAYVQALCAQMKPDEKALFKSELLGRARQVAEASGGLLGMGNRVSKSEEDALRRLEAAFS